MVNGVEHVDKGHEDEFELIANVFAPLAKESGALGLRDDAAVLRPPEGHEIVVSCDAINEGVHFLKDDPADSIGHKALAVTLSDLAAKGARPYAYLLSLSLPRNVVPDWLADLAAGLRALQTHAGVALVGGDTTSSLGGVSIVVTGLGLVPQGHAVLRLGANPGDRFYVSGTIGDAYLGLRLLQDPARAKAWGLVDEDVAFLVERYRRPTPRCDLALLVRNFAQASIDISDGLVGDIEKLCRVSHVGMTLNTERVPFSPAARKALAAEPGLLPELITAGDDYELVVAVPERSAAAFEAEIEAKQLRFAPMGEATAGDPRVTVRDAKGEAIVLSHRGFSHF
jgi:thiamine-monophosphate kinase